MENSSFQLVPHFVTETDGTEAYCTRFSPDASFLATSCGSGAVCVTNMGTGQAAYRLERSRGKLGHPAKQLCWRPETSGSSLRTRGVLASVSTDGMLRKWHVASGKLLQELGDPEKTGQLLSVDYCPDASRLVAGGLRELWVFDEETQKQTMCLDSGDGFSTAGHSNRVFATKFFPDMADNISSNLIVSGGWDESLKIWDLRVGHAVRSIFGPNISGDSLDISPDGRTILTGSWREEDPLELWDFGTGKRSAVLPWRRSKGSLREAPCSLYAARFSGSSPSGGMIAAGGSCSGGTDMTVPSPGAEKSPSGEAKIFDRRDEGTCSCIGTFTRLTCLSADFSGRSPAAQASDLVALAGSDGRTRVLRLTKQADNKADVTVELSHTVESLS